MQDDPVSIGPVFFTLHMTSPCLLSTPDAASSGSPTDQHAYI